MSRKSLPWWPTKPEPCALQNIRVEPLAVDVVHEDRVAILVRPGAAQIDHRAGSARVRRPHRSSRRCRACGVVADVVPMVGDRLNVGVGVRIEVLARLPLVSGALNHVIQVRNDARRAERLAVVVEIDAPRIARAFGEDFELVPRRVIPPDARVDRHALGFGVPGLPTFECVNTPWQP